MSGQIDSTVQTALALIEKHGWDEFSLTHLAVELRRPLYEVQEFYGDKYGILQALFVHVNAQVDIKGSGEENVHDWLFELFMERFDALEPYKKALQSVSPYIFSDPELFKLISCNLYGWMDHLPDASFQKHGGARLIRPACLSLVYAAALETWLEDDSIDCSHTMATLDQRLTDFEVLL